MKRLSAVFSEPPGKWGLRGKPQLWEEFKAHFARMSDPRTEESLLEAMYSAFEQLTGRPVLADSFIVVRRYECDGLGANMVDPWNWRAVVIPALAKRYREAGDIR